jgi:hypothetical protein
MENTNKTRWNKKKEFSDTPGESFDENFQTINMIKKIRKAKKPKNSELNVENYKNIEPLQNIYDNTPVEKTKEGFTDDDYDGIEKPFDKDRPDNPKTALINFIDSCFDAIDKFNHEKAKLIADIFSNKTSTKQDVKLLQKYIGLFETIGVSYFVAYNWFFYLFYDVNYDPTRKTGLDQTKEKEKAKQPIYSQKEVTEASRKYPLIDLWIWFGEYVILFTEYFQWVMLSILPFFFSIFNYKTCFIFLFFSFIYILFNFLPTLRNVLVDSLNMNVGNKIVMAMLIFFIVMYAPSYWFPAKSDNANDQAAAANTQNLVMMSWFILIPFIIYRCIRAFFVVLLTIPLGALALAFYVFFYSFFGVLSYYFFNIFKAYDAFNNMYVYIKDGEFRYFTEEQKENFNVIQKFGLIINNFFESLHRYILFIVYIIMLLVAAVDYFYLIKAPLLKTNMLIISFVLCCICISIIITSFINHARNDENA